MNSTNNLVPFANNDGLELVINTNTGETFAPGYRALARICSLGLEKPISDVQAKRYVSSLVKGATDYRVIEADVQTPGGKQGATLIPEKLVARSIRKFNELLSEKIDEAGTRVFLHKLAGYEVKSTATQEFKPIDKQATSAKKLADLILMISERSNLSPEVSGQLALQAVSILCPAIAPALKPAQQALINSTASADNLLTATQIGDRLNLSGQKVNKLLISKGLQTKNDNKSSQKEAGYFATERGRKYSSVVQSAIGGGSTTQQLRWYESVVPLIAKQQ